MESEDHSAEQNYLDVIRRASPGMDCWILGEDGRTPILTDLAGLVAWAVAGGGLSVRIAHDEVGDIEVSTIFLGQIAPSNSGLSERLFETKVFGPDRTELGGEEYRSWEDAEAGHARHLARLATATSPRPH